MVSKVRVGFRGWFLYIRSALKGYETVICNGIHHNHSRRELTAA